MPWFGREMNNHWSELKREKIHQYCNLIWEILCWTSHKTHSNTQLISLQHEFNTTRRVGGPNQTKGNRESLKPLIPFHISSTRHFVPVHDSYIACFCIPVPSSHWSSRPSEHPIFPDSFLMDLWHPNILADFHHPVALKDVNHLNMHNQASLKNMLIT